MNYDRPASSQGIDRRRFLKLSAGALASTAGGISLGAFQEEGSARQALKSGGKKVESANEREAVIVDSGRPQVSLACWKEAGEVQRAAVELFQIHLEERAGVRLPEMVMQDARLSGLQEDAHPGVLLAGTLEQIEKLGPFGKLAKYLRARIGPEGFYLGFPEISGQGRVAVIGADEKGVLYGMGRLLRSMRFSGRDVVAGIGEIYAAPATSIRGHLLANHLWSPQYDNWDEGQWDRYLADLSLWGVNTVLNTPYHPGEWAACEPFHNPPLFRNEQVRRAWEFYWRVQQAVPKLAKKYGMRYGLWIPPNDIPVDEARPQTEGGRCDNVCPSRPDMRALILRHREAVFEALNPLDLVIVPASDCGGCSCPACSPWIKTYLPLAEEIAGALHRHHPGAWMGISNQNLSREEDEWLFRYLQEKRPGWLKFIVHGPGSSDIRKMDREIPLEYDLFLYPDTTHMAASPGYLVSDLDTDPLIWRVYQQAHLEATPFARPAALAEAYPRYRHESQGSFPYSEGSHDDLNKVIWSQLDWDPKADVAMIVKDYCAFYYGGHPSLSDVWYRLERALTLSPADNPEIDSTLSIVEEARRQLPGWALHGWRWKMLEVRSLLDRFLRLYLQMGRQVEESLKECLKMDRPELAVRDMAAIIRDAGPRPVLDDLRLDLGAMFPYFVSAEVARKERKECGEMPSHPLQDQMKSWTKDLREMELLDHRIQSLAWELRKETGLEMRAAWVIRGAKTPCDWCMDSLEALACGPDPQPLKQEITKALSPEEAEAAGAYDDLGHPQKQPHLLEGRRWEDSFGDNFLRDRLAAERRAVSPYGEDLVLKYEGLREDAAYEIRITYAQSRHETRKQRLAAVTPKGEVAIHPPLLLPARPRSYTFPLPPGAISEGRLELHLIRTEGRPHNSVASEVWLFPNQG